MGSFLKNQKHPIRAPRASGTHGISGAFGSRGATLNRAPNQRPNADGNIP